MQIITHGEVHQSHIDHMRAVERVNNFGDDTICHLESYMTDGVKIWFERCERGSDCCGTCHGSVV